jgi:hypothetical protein
LGPPDLVGACWGGSTNLTAIKPTAAAVAGQIHVLLMRGTLFGLCPHLWASLGPDVLYVMVVMYIYDDMML